MCRCLSQLRIRPKRHFQISLQLLEALGPGEKLLVLKTQNEMGLASASRGQRWAGKKWSYHSSIHSRGGKKRKRTLRTQDAY